MAVVIATLIALTILCSPGNSVHVQKKLMTTMNNHKVQHSKNSSTSSSMSTSSTPKLTAMFMIGDSTVECFGGLFSDRRLNFSEIACPNHGNNHSSLVPYFLAGKMGLNVFQDYKTVWKGLVGTYTFGTIEATIHTSLSSENLSEQLTSAYGLLDYIVVDQQLDRATADNLISSTIFYLSIGKDDYINFFFPSSSNRRDFSSDIQEFSRSMVNHMIQALRDLYYSGVRKVVIMGILPIGCAPKVVVDWHFTRSKNGRASGGCVAEINQVIQQYNQHLNGQIMDLNSEFSDSHFVFCDAYRGFMQILSNPQRYGFEDVTSACCGKGWHGAAAGCDYTEKACNKTSNLWWDYYNPTAAFNSLLADSVWSGRPLANLCQPLTVRGLIRAK